LTRDDAHPARRAAEAIQMANVNVRKDGFMQTFSAREFRSGEILPGFDGEAGS
jgi:hypothetical protein